MKRRHGRDRDAVLVDDPAEVAIAMMRARMTPDQAIALTYGAEIADAVRGEIAVLSRRRKITAARRLDRDR
jgi:hypothetical protein